MGRCLKLWVGKGLYSWLCQLIYIYIYICFIWFAKNETCWGNCWTLPSGFLSQGQEDGCDRPHVSPVWGGCLSVALPSWALPSCWLFWGIAPNFFCCCCSRLWTRGARETRELILHCGVMEALGGTWGILFVLLFFFPYQPFQDFLEQLWEIWANLSLWTMLKCFVWYVPSWGSELYLCSRSFSWQIWCVWCPTPWVAWRPWLLWHGHPHLCLLKPTLGR